MRANEEVVIEPTCEVVDKTDSKSIFKGSGQQCADFMYMRKGIGVFMRTTIFN